MPIMLATYSTNEVIVSDMMCSKERKRKKTTKIKHYPDKHTHTHTQTRNITKNGRGQL